MRLKFGINSLKTARTVSLHFLKLTLAALLSISGVPFMSPVYASDAAVYNKYFNCTDLKIIWARESGASQNDRNYQEFEKAYEKVFKNSGISYSFYELSREGGFGGYYYTAPGIGVSDWTRFKTSLGALFSGGDSYAYGESIEAGSSEAAAFISAYVKKCPSSKIVLGGFSQGAQVVSRTLQKISAKNLLYAATFGDPKLYLPEGKGITPAACRNENLSVYRAYVPDCHVYEGALGSYRPYDVDSSFYDKVGAYCRYHDIICGVVTDLENWYDGHADYIGGGVYDLAAWDTYVRIAPSKVRSRYKQNVAILFDRTGSMGPMFETYQESAIKTAREVVRNGGSIALYTYGDLNEYGAEKLCGFNECSLPEFEDKIHGIWLSGGHDEEESLLSAAKTAMMNLNWELNANKSIVAITDAGFLNPDRDNVTVSEVVSLSKKIDPVNFYILTSPEAGESYEALADETGGKVYLDSSDFDFETILDDIYANVPSNILNSDTTKTESEISNLNFSLTSSSSAEISFSSTGEKTLVFLNENLLGYTNEIEFTLTDLDLDQDNSLLLVPLSADGYRGTSASLELKNSIPAESEISSSETLSKIIIPKAPNTGSR